MRMLCAVLESTSGEVLLDGKEVTSMGDPVETGVSLDRVHRPHMEWSALLLVGVIGIFSVILYMFAPFDYNEDIQNMSWYGMRQLVFTVAGYAVMLLVCRLDYSILDRFGTLVDGNSGNRRLIAAGVWDLRIWVPVSVGWRRWRGGGRLEMLTESW